MTWLLLRIGHKNLTWIMSIVLGALSCGFSPLACHSCQSSSMSLLPKVFIASFIIYWEMTKAWEVWLLSIRSVPKSAFGLMQKPSKCVRHAEENRQETKRKAIRPRVWLSEKHTWVKSWSRESHSAIVRETQVRASAWGGAVHVKKKGETQWECERVKKKNETFFNA